MQRVATPKEGFPSQIKHKRARRKPRPLSSCLSLSHDAAQGTVNHREAVEEAKRVPGGSHCPEALSCLPVLSREGRPVVSHCNAPKHVPPPCPNCPMTALNEALVTGRVSPPDWEALGGRGSGDLCPAPPRCWHMGGTPCLPKK